MRSTGLVLGTCEDEEDGGSVRHEETRSDFTRANKNDVNHVVNILKDKLGHTHHHLFAENDTNPFHKGGGNPLLEVELEQQAPHEFVQHHLEKNETQYVTDTLAISHESLKIYGTAVHEGGLEARRSCLVLSISVVHCGNEFRNSRGSEGPRVLSFDQRRENQTQRRY